MHTKQMNEQRNKTCVWWKCLLKIPDAKHVLYWEKKDQTFDVIWRKKKQIKSN